MMISPESFFEFELKDKSKEDIAKVIRGLKKEIGELKKSIESPDYEHEDIIKPSAHTRLWCTRLYLERAIQAYSDTGGEYQLSKAEQKVAEFDAAIPMISKIVFTIGGFFGGYETRTIRLDDEHLYLWVEHSLMSTPSNLEILPDYPVTKDEFLAGLREIHIGEWTHHYDNPCVMDGTQWSLLIEYVDSRKPEKYEGSNAYPFSFDAFRALIGSSDDDYEEEEDECD